MDSTETNDIQPIRRCSLFRRVKWHPRDAIVGILLSLLMAGLIFVRGCGIFKGQSFAGFVVMTAVLQVGVLLAFPLWVVRRRGYSPNPKSPTVGFMAREFLMAIPLTFGILVSAAIVAYTARLVLIKLTYPAQSPLDFWGRFSMHDAAVMMLMAVTIAPVAEEVFFRGFLYNSLRGFCPAWVALLGQACLFGVGHIYQPLGVVTTFVIGLLLAAIYEWRRTLLTTILAHGMYNAIAAIGVFAAVWINTTSPVIGITCSREMQGQVVVDQVLPRSPAEAADIRSGDVIIKYNNHEVSDFAQLLQFIRAGRVGDTATVEILRGQTRMTKRLTFGPHEDGD
jgi:membrane protease YdiL (CAAX protease family)